MQTKDPDRVILPPPKTGPMTDATTPNIQNQVEQLSQEVLELYRQVNLLYRLGDIFRSGMSVKEVCRVLIKESARAVRASGAIIKLNDGTSYGTRKEAPTSRLTVPIETPSGKIGDVTFFDKRRGFFSAADEKLVRAVARQAGVALENSQRIEGLVQQNLALERLNQELRAIDQMKSDFVSNVSHELRTPLASIKGFAATIIDDADMPLDIAREFVGIINDESDKLIVIINDLLDVSKMMSGHTDYHLESAPMEKVLTDVVNLLKIQAKAKDLVLELEISNRAHVEIDSTRMSQVFVNLIGNAIKFTDQGSITVQQCVVDEELRISVSDTGMGIPPDLLPHIFDKFYRVENVVHTKEGTGLGLALVRGIVDYHGGRVNVESQPGIGSVFTVYLPLGHRSISKSLPEQSR
ncbi:MAG: ATP-binding protein [Bradymonadia bacterium]